MDQSPNLQLPYILPSQAQKHVTHNEALDVLDALVQLAVESATVTTPPGAPGQGLRHIVPPSASGAWSGHSGKIAVFTVADWNYVTPTQGMQAWVKDAAAPFVYSGSAWVRLSSMPAGDVSADTVGINATANSYNRLTVSAPSTLLTHQGGDHRLVINKSSAGHTGSLLMQNDWQGRAELGLAGSDDFSFKVSADGSAWHTAMTIARGSGTVSFPVGIRTPGHILQAAASRLTSGFTTTLATPQPTGLDLAITPVSATSKVVVRTSLTVGGDFWSAVPLVAIFRDGAKVWPSQPGVHMQHQMLADTAANSRLISYQAAVEFEDLPATTSAVTYEVRLASSAAGTPVHLNIRDSDLSLRGESNLSVTEIAT
ncbi:Protein of unknown function [Mesorhizobium albiziae]|uniref:DUF2793 domain-containing protein n=1 Tax=Neomesorhizobium albiziae TaxID=335020 RepID=A0A1I4BIN9_9HYPH|nr:DUF2793 domain-containing protein [Mesorhizobium albiziae]GLS29875.1 hypothetical protein GCM10007937_15830 [Mesorhizobium albiziae]SFK67869.1 Protein of unknown function [Mesorhizobium albiziae]